MTEKNTDGWIERSANEWLRKVDGVRVRRADAGWNHAHRLQKGGGERCRAQDWATPR